MNECFMNHSSNYIAPKKRKQNFRLKNFLKNKTILRSDNKVFIKDCMIWLKINISKFEPALKI